MACWMTTVTASGCEIRVRCEPPSKMVTCEWARAAMAFSDVGVMIWSPLLMKYHDGIVLHAAYFDGVSKALVDALRWVAHSCVASSVGRSLPKFFRKMSFLR